MGKGGNMLGWGVMLRCQLPVHGLWGMIGAYQYKGCLLGCARRTKQGWWSPELTIVLRPDVMAVCVCMHGSCKRLFVLDTLFNCLLGAVCTRLCSWVWLVFFYAIMQLHNCWVHYV